MARKADYYAAERPDVFDTLGATGDEPTPLRLRELAVSAARFRELEARRLGLELTAFRLEIRDIDAAAFSYDIAFSPALDCERNGPMTLAERLGLEVAEFLHARLETYAAGYGEKP